MNKLSRPGARGSAAALSKPASPSQNGLAARLALEITERARRLRMEPGTHLSELGLAEAFRVSRTPVRQALEALLEQGVVERQRNRGFFLKSLPPPVEQEPAAVVEPGEDPLYFRIADDHLSGALGERVLEKELIRRYGATKAQVLRLLSRMVQEGWVEKLPGQGWAFMPVLRSAETYAQGYRFRILMEPAALLEPGYRLESATIEHLRREQHAMLAGGWQTFSRAETHRIGADFHEALVAGSGNLFMIDALRRLNRTRRLMEYKIHHDRTRLVRICSEHLRLLDLIEAGDLRKAADFLRQHLDTSQIAKEPLVQEEFAEAGACGGAKP